jgi:ubiquinone/menaquinone biosynthesis C-methylase UbiE
MSSVMEYLDFQLGSLWFGLRDKLSPPGELLAEARIREGACVLDYGCGPGGYTLAVTELAGPSGRVYAADVNPLALKRVRARAAKKGFSNIETIQTDCATGLQSASVDVALLYDTCHDLVDPADVLEELHRVLKPGGILSFSDHHLSEQEIVATVTAGGLFKLSRKNAKTYSFLKEE